jgi:hypothetical protein
MWSKNDISGAVAYLRMPYAESNDLNSVINCPPDMIPDVIDFTIKGLGIEVKMPAMSHNENIESKNILG